MLAKPEPPDIPIGDHCFTPYECPYYAHCSKGMVFPENGLDQLHRLHPNRRAQLEALGIDSIEDIPPDFDLNEMQQRIRRAVITQQPWQSENLAEALDKSTGRSTTWISRPSSRPCRAIRAQGPSRPSRSSTRFTTRRLKANSSILITCTPKTPTPAQRWPAPW